MNSCKKRKPQPSPSRGGLHHRAAQLTGQLLGVDLVAVLADHVHHVDGDDHRDTQLGKLGGQVEVTLQIGAVDDVEDGVGPLTDQVVTGTTSSSV